jgi:hypothetical protein
MPTSFNLSQNVRPIYFPFSGLLILRIKHSALLSPKTLKMVAHCFPRRSHRFPHSPFTKKLTHPLLDDRAFSASAILNLSPS